MGTAYEPCAKCGKDHDTSRCPSDPNFGRRGEALKAWRRMSATKGAKEKYSMRRIDRALKEIRE